MKKNLGSKNWMLPRSEWMEVLMASGSPRQNGNTARALKEVAGALKPFAMFYGHLLMVVSAIALSLGAEAAVHRGVNDGRPDSDVKHIGGGGASAARGRNAPAKKADVRSRTGGGRKLTLPQKPKDGDMPVNFQVNLKGRIESFCGYELGTTMKLQAKPILDKHGNIIVTERLKKPFHKCSQVELKYSKINHALYSIRLFSPPQEKRMSDAEVTSELNGMLDELKAKLELGKEDGSWTRLPQLFIVPVGKATGQWLMLDACQDEADGQQAPKGAKPDKGWTFSVKLEDSLLKKYRPETDGCNRGSPEESGNTDKRRELLPILIFGSDEFVEKTEDALFLIKEKSPRSYELVTNYVSIIQSAEKSGMRAFNNPPIFQVGSKTAQSDLRWYASSIVHDAYHSKLYNDYRKKFNRKVPSEIWKGRNAENSCLSAQEVFLKDIGAPERWMKHIQNGRTRDYFSDYKNRNW